jgi:hypothetical protein
LIQINGQVDFTEDQLAVARHGAMAASWQARKATASRQLPNSGCQSASSAWLAANAAWTSSAGRCRRRAQCCSVPAWRTLQGHGMGQVRGQDVAEQARAQRMGQAIHDVLQEIYAGNVRRARRRVVQVQAPVALQGRGQQAAQRPRQDGPKCPWR